MDDISQIEARARAVRIPLYKLCLAAKVSPATISRWKRGDHTPSVGTLDKLERELARLEADRNAA